jgi:galactokinase
MHPLARHVLKEFHARFKASPEWLVRAPGRVNLIGEHTDYNDGFVLPLAIDRQVWIALRPRPDRNVVPLSLEFNEEIPFDLDRFQASQAGWAEYLKGVAWALQDSGYALLGWEGVLSGDVPVGAGLSSSAALEMATARAFSAVSGFLWQPAVMARLGQRAENNWVGVNCGIMDQLISACGVAEHAVLIDCRSLDTQPVPLPPQTAVVILDTATRRGLVGSAYNERRAQCEAAARFFGVPALRDVSLQAFNRRAAELDEVTRRRARHVISENERTLQAAQAMRRGQAAELGRLMNDSHTSLRDDFEVSSRELNLMVELAQAQPACYGARMTGAGFGGCTVALVQAQAAGDFCAQVKPAYQAETGLEPSLYVCSATNGAEIVPLA